MARYSTPKDQWDYLISKMDKIPDERKPFTEANAKWFVRSGWIFNQNNRYLNELMEFAKKQF